MRSDLLTVVTPIFNPRRFKSRIRLYEDFRRMVEDQGCRLITVEAVFGDREPEIKPGKDVITLRTSAELWHKERLINIGIKHAMKTAPDTAYLSWIDADVSFSNPNWAAEAVHSLQHHDVIQLFSQAAFLNSKDEVLWTCPSAFKVFLDKGFHQHPPVKAEYIAKGHPGLAWAATADALHRLEGLLDTCVSGSGDTLMAWALRGRWDGYLPPDPLTPGYIEHLKRWAQRCDMHIRENVGYINGTCLHFWHGKSEQRGYDKRWQIISYHKFDPAQDLLVDKNGLYKWSGHKPKLEQDLRLSMSARNEDALT
jgi:hypothetical protein